MGDVYWKRFLGIEVFKLKHYFRVLLYRLGGLRLPKLKDQRHYWRDRGEVYMREILESGYLDREVFFQDLLITQLRTLEFSSFFEAGCGFGWNVKRVKQEFPNTFVGGIDFSESQLRNGQHYLKGTGIPVACGDNCCLPLKDKSFDVGFSLGVFMNIHPNRILSALQEMARVCGKYIIHIEYDENHTTPELREKRSLKPNIVSHDYAGLYRELGLPVVAFQTFKDFGQAYHEHAARITKGLDRWEGFEGPEKYIFLVVKTG